MLSRERVIATIQHQKPDRIPIYAWAEWNLRDKINERFGSYAAFEDHYEFDFAHLFGGPRTYAPDAFENINRDEFTPADLLDIPLADPNDRDAYAAIIDGVRHHKAERGRFVYVQTPGIFEANNGAFGIENHLMHMALHEDDLHRVYQRQAAWNRAFALNCLELGVDMIHVSDDWGSQNALMFSPQMWRDLIFPHHKITCDAVKERGGFLSLHSDGNINMAVAGIIELGYDVVHPWQESAGMSLTQYRNNYRDKFIVMGGLDVQTTIGFGNYDLLRAEILRVLQMFRDGGLLYCTTHFIQEHCTIEELVFAYDLIYQTVREG